MNVYDNISYGLKVQRLSKTDIDNKVKEALGLLNLIGMEDRFPNQLSGGQQQRVAIARALVNNTELLLLDEPLSNLDAKLRESVRVELRQIQKKLGITMIYVTHDQQEALSMSDMIVVMNRGTIQEMGTPQDIYYNPKTKFVAEFIGTTNFITGKKTNKKDMIGLEYCNQTIFGDDINTDMDTITYSIRPESIRLSREIFSSCACLKCDIKYSMFLGEKIRYFAEDECGKEWIIDEFDSGHDVKSGSSYIIIPNGKPHFVID
jgi:ABC-type Fe3+/spermidine/putrescine transport system ATPase subunit